MRARCSRLFGVGVGDDDNYYCSVATETENFDTEDWNTIAIFEAKRCARRTKIGSKFYVFISKSLFGVDRSRVVRPPKRMNETVEQIYTDNTE